MSIWQIIRRLVPFVRPYSRWVFISLVLTLLGACAAQVNPIVLRYTVDTIERLLREGRTASQGASLLILISAILLAKEILNTGLKYGQNIFGEKIRVNVSSRLSQFAVEKILTYRLAFYSDTDNQTGILQTRIDRGADSLTKLVQSAFIAIATEQIKNSLDAIKESRTTVVISHSISQIIDADIIYVLKEGRVVEHGTHEELYEKDGTYSEIFNASARSLNIDRIARTLDVELSN